MITCTRKLEFDAAHRVCQHEHKCRFLHGHRYVVEATFSAKDLDSLGRVIDFGVVKERLGAWIEEHWDHSVILSHEDKELGGEIERICEQKVYYVKGNPTAEHLALYLFHEICPKVFSEKHVQCTHIRLYETPNCWADAKA